jgi:hypothetical protein
MHPLQLLKQVSDYTYNIDMISGDTDQTLQAT